MQCRICFGEDGEMISPCKCTAPVHEACLLKWLCVSGRDSCEICLEKFPYDDIYDDIYADADSAVILIYALVMLGFFCGQFVCLI